MAKDSSKYYAQDSSAMMIPIYNPQKNKKTSSKCFVYFFATFVFLCFLVFIVACIVIPVKNPTLQMNSIVIKSLNYDYSPSFKLTALLNVTIKNHNFGYLYFDDKSNNSISMIYGNGNVLGTSKLVLRNNRVELMGKQEVVVEMKASSLKGNVSVLKDDDRMKLNSDLSSGSLEFVVVVSSKFYVHFVKDKIMLPAVANMNCTIGIDLRNNSVRKLIC